MGHPTWLLVWVMPEVGSHAVSLGHYPWVPSDVGFNARCGEATPTYP
jgi:hypothetical protein